MESNEMDYNGAGSKDPTSGILKTKISLGKNPSVIMPFYIKIDLPGTSSLTGNVDLLSYYKVDDDEDSVGGEKKVREELSALLPHLPGDIDVPAGQDNSSLRQLIEKPPILGKEIMPLTSTSLSGFRLAPGQIPEQYRSLTGSFNKKRHKRKSRRSGGDDSHDEKSDKKGKKPKSADDREKRKKKKKDKRKRRGSPDPSGSGATNSPAVIL